MIKYYSFKKDVVFDPFVGSGTVGIVSTYTDRRFILIEKEMKVAMTLTGAKSITDISSELLVRNLPI